MTSTGRKSGQEIPRSSRRERFRSAPTCLTERLLLPLMVLSRRRPSHGLKTFHESSRLLIPQVPRIYPQLLPLHAGRTVAIEERNQELARRQVEREDNPRDTIELQAAALQIYLR